MKYLFFIIILCFPFLSKAQTGHRLIYNLKYQIDSTDINSVRDEIYYLDMFGNESYFLSKDQFVKDSFLLASTDQQLMSMMGNPANRPKYPKNTYIITIKQNTIKHYEKVVLQEFAYEEELNLDWKLSDDTLTIGNYLCQKATTYFAGRNYEAWYTTAIPLTAFPYKFGGLLGTTLRIVDSKNHYQFDLMEIQTVQKYIIIYDSVDKHESNMSKKEFWENRKKMNQNPELKFANSGISFGDGNNERMRKKTEARLKRENNPIELE
ncbi:Protein of unknown function (Porph_ging) [Bernardetia litoralis DSM 6794]|uniref:GLPGLI family protein n=1 Tax=Bernardetia litoralis (strain ATCC 23117 / DSM 6794 / NBRC 15988 / NCIMB 1366 / Fx l1 / Sio-4) TaxID=880071 RepID=I4AHY0_BERLS|nr:GLPGLI family protein [Bernardetia litoralis]AFM03565.1 Protein of unknown function (Porph_ging) [Bernardetia litoralis DSM 6794]